MNENAEPFFLVWNPDGRNPQCKHTSRDAALREAKRLAAAVPGQKFYVLQTLDLAATRDPVEVVHMVANHTDPHDDGLPF